MQDAATPVTSGCTMLAPTKARRECVPNQTKRVSLSDLPILTC